MFSSIFTATLFLISDADDALVFDSTYVPTATGGDVAMEQAYAALSGADDADLDRPMRAALAALAIDWPEPTDANHALNALAYAVEVSQ